MKRKLSRQMWRVARYGITARHQWQAFWTLYRLSQRQRYLEQCVQIHNDWLMLMPFQWHRVAENGDCRSHRDRHDLKWLEVLRHKLIQTNETGDVYERQWVLEEINKVRERISRRKDMDRVAILAKLLLDGK